MEGARLDHILASCTDVSTLGVSENLYLPALVDAQNWLRPALWRYQRGQKIWERLCVNLWCPPLDASHPSLSPRNRFNLTELRNVFLDAPEEAATWQIRRDGQLIAQTRVDAGVDIYRHLEAVLGFIPIAALSNEQSTRYTWELNGTRVYTVVVVWDRGEDYGCWHPLAFDPDPMFRPLTDGAPGIVPAWRETQVAVARMSAPEAVRWSAAWLPPCELAEWTGLRPAPYRASEGMQFQEYFIGDTRVPGRDRLYFAKQLMGITSFGDTLRAYDPADFKNPVANFTSKEDARMWYSQFFPLWFVTDNKIDMPLIGRALERLVRDMGEWMRGQRLEEVKSYRLPTNILHEIATHVVSVSLRVDFARRCISPTELRIRELDWGAGPVPPPLTPQEALVAAIMYRSETQGLDAVANLGMFVFRDTTGEPPTGPTKRRPRTGGLVLPTSLALASTPDQMKALIASEFFEELYTGDRQESFRASRPPEAIFMEDLVKNLSVLRLVPALKVHVSQWKVYAHTSPTGVLHLVVGAYPYFVVRQVRGQYGWLNLGDRPLEEVMRYLVPLEKAQVLPFVRRVLEQDRKVMCLPSLPPPAEYTFHEGASAQREDTEPKLNVPQVWRMLSELQAILVRDETAHHALRLAYGVAGDTAISVGTSLARALMLVLQVEAVAAGGTKPPVFFSSAELDDLAQEASARTTPHPLVSFIEPCVSLLEVASRVERNVLNDLFAWKDLEVILLTRHRGGLYTQQSLRRPGLVPTSTSSLHRANSAVLVVHEGGLYVVPNPAVVRMAAFHKETIALERVAGSAVDKGWAINYALNRRAISSVPLDALLPLRQLSFLFDNVRPKDEEGAATTTVDKAHSTTPTTETMWPVLPVRWSVFRTTLDKLPRTDNTAWVLDGYVMYPVRVVFLEGQQEVFARQQGRLSNMWSFRTRRTQPGDPDYGPGGEDYDPKVYVHGLSTSAILPLCEQMGFDLSTVQVRVWAHMLARPILAGTQADNAAVVIPRIDALVRFQAA